MTITAEPLRFLTPFGSKPTSPLFIFLPGMDGTGQLLQPQLAGLGTAFNMRCLSIPSDDLTDWDGLVEQTANLIHIEQKRSSHQPIYLCGESFGGCFALKLAAEFPQLCNRLILVNPASSVSRQPWMGWGVSLAQGLPTPFYQISTLGLLPFLIVPQRVSRQNRRALLTAMQSILKILKLEKLSADGDTVPETFKVKFGLTGMGIAPAGIEKPNTGHHHLLVDLRELPDFTVYLPATDHIRHFGAGQTETTLTLPPGKHKLQL